MVTHIIKTIFSELIFCVVYPTLSIRSDTITDYNVISEKVESMLNVNAKKGNIDTLKSIVKTVFDLVSLKPTEFRTLVGDDAKMVLKLRETQPIENFLEYMRGQF